MFRSVNELNNFSFEDCVLAKTEYAKDGIVFELEALIVKANNSQNANFTDSYAGTAFLKFQNASIKKIVKAGYRYYDADGKLIKSVPDEPVPASEHKALIPLFAGSYLCACDREQDGYTLEVEMCEEDGVGDTYLLDISCGDAIVSWDKYMNRVQR